MEESRPIGQPTPRLCFSIITLPSGNFWLLRKNLVGNKRFSFFPPLFPGLMTAKRTTRNLVVHGPDDPLRHCSPLRDGRNSQFSASAAGGQTCLARKLRGEARSWKQPNGQNARQTPAPRDRGAILPSSQGISPRPTAWGGEAEPLGLAMRTAAAAALNQHHVSRIFPIVQASLLARAHRPSRTMRTLCTVRHTSFFFLDIDRKANASRQS